MLFRTFFHTGLYALMHENGMMMRILNDESTASASTSHALHTLIRSTKVRLNEVKQLVQNLTV